MIQTISVNPPEKLQNYTEFKISNGELNGFPFFSIDRDSYIVQAEVQSGINFRPKDGRHCLTIGKGCSLADGITFIIDLNHDYRAVSQGANAFLDGIVPMARTPRKGTIVIQNDVWIGHGATIMAGVTLHNGCIVAAEAVVTKDVPPYAMVGGNPAKVFGYRFAPDAVTALQRIAWWDWPKEIQWGRRESFALPVEEFIEKYLPQAEDTGATPLSGNGPSTIYFPADVGEPFPLYPKVLEKYFQKDRPNVELLIYIPVERSIEKNIRDVECILEKYEARNSCVTLQTGVTLDERILLQGADYYVTTRAKETVYRTCLADRYGTKVLYGTDDDLFPSSLQ